MYGQCMDRDKIARAVELQTYKTVCLCVGHTLWSGMA